MVVPSSGSTYHRDGEVLFVVAFFADNQVVRKRPPDSAYDFLLRAQIGGRHDAGPRRVFFLNIERRAIAALDNDSGDLGGFDRHIDTSH